MDPKPIDARELLDVVRPGLARGDAGLLAEAIRKRWTASQICPLLQNTSRDVRRVAAVTLGLVGDRQVEGCLVQALHDIDEQVNAMAEHSLWSIWFRSGSAQAARPFREGVALLGTEAHAQAAECFLKAVRIDPNFAEAYNQCAIAHFFVGQWEESIHFSNRAIKLVPAHYGAISGMGHCYCQLGDLHKAMQCYRWALRINPRMPKISAAIDSIEDRMRDINESSGMFTSPGVGA